jgi:ribosome biogenesis protein Nip4
VDKVERERERRGEKEGNKNIQVENVSTWESSCIVHSLSTNGTCVVVMFEFAVRYRNKPCVHGLCKEAIISISTDFLSQI